VLPRRTEFDKLERTFTLIRALCYSTISYWKDAWQSEKEVLKDHRWSSSIFWGRLFEHLTGYLARLK